MTPEGSNCPVLRNKSKYGKLGENVDYFSVGECDSKKLIISKKESGSNKSQFKVMELEDLNSDSKLNRFYNMNIGKLLWQSAFNTTIKFYKVFSFLIF